MERHELKINARRVLLLIVTGMAAVVIAAASYVIWVTVSFARGDNVCRDVVVSGLELGGLPRAEAAERLRAWSRERVDRRITLTALDTRWSGKLSDFGARVDWEQALRRAYAVGRVGTFAQRVVCVMTSGGSGKRLEARVLLDGSVVGKVVEKVATTVNRPHTDARIAVVDGRIEISQDRWGIKLNVPEAVSAVKSAVLSGEWVVAMPLEAARPDVTAQEAAAIDTLLGSFTTSFNPAVRDRTHNLKLAAKAVDGLLIKPGGEFSYNETVGPRVTARGYRDAIIFVQGRMETGVGGGICQVSSTLYNAVLLAGLEVTQRSPHSRTVPYVTPGRDATVSYGVVDFRFRNTASSPVGLVSRVEGAKLTIDVYGAAVDRKDIKLFTDGVRYTSAGSKEVVDGSLKPGQKRLVDEGSRGVSVALYRKITAPDGSSVTEVVSRTRYPAHARVVAVGPKSEGAGAAPQPTTPSPVAEQ